MKEKKLTRTALATDYIEEEDLPSRPLRELADMIWEIVSDIRKLRDIIDDNQLNKLKEKNVW